MSRAGCYVSFGFFWAYASASGVWGKAACGCSVAPHGLWGVVESKYQVINQKILITLGKYFIRPGLSRWTLSLTLGFSPSLLISSHPYRSSPPSRLFA